MQAWDPSAWDGGAFWALAPAARLFAAHRQWPSVTEIDALLAPLAGVRFVAARPRPRRQGRPVVERGYDERICEDGVVPTRARNWHDFFNALVWATFPRAKRALHRRQHRAAGEGRGRRTREQDCLAMLDEGGVVVLQHGARSVDVVYGHAVYEQLARRGPPVRAMAHVVACDGVPADEGGRVAAADLGLTAALERPGSFLDPGQDGSHLVSR
jgi:hypothetical protein